MKYKDRRKQLHIFVYCQQVGEIKKITIDTYGIEQNRIE